MNYPDAYLARVLRTKGVPEMWIEDGIQDCRLYFWRWGCTGTTSVHSAAVDAGRKYGHRTKRGKERAQMMPLEDALGVKHEDDHTGPEVREFLASLTPRERRMVVNKIRGFRFMNTADPMRKKWRKW